MSSYKPMNEYNTPISLIDTETENAFVELDSTPRMESQPLQPDVVQPQIPINPTNSHMFQINFYRKFFDLDSEQFFQKIQQALNPLNKESSPVGEDDDSHVTELYGVIWITGTLIFLMFVSATGSNLLSQWLHPTDKKESYEYSFELLTKSISVFYGYNIVVPLLLVVVTSWVLKFPHRLSFTKVMSIYGYTNVLWIPITLINFLIVVLISNKHHHTLLNALEWTIVAVSGLVTGLSNLSKISPIIKKNALVLADGDLDLSKKQHLALVGGLALAHAIFTVIVKITFFGISV